MTLLKPHYEKNMKMTVPKKAKPVKTVVVSPALQKVIGPVNSRNNALQQVRRYLLEISSHLDINLYIKTVLELCEAAQSPRSQQEEGVPQ